MAGLYWYQRKLIRTHHHSIIILGKLSKSLFPATNALPHVSRAGDVFYTVGVLAGLILWGFATVWLIVAVMMILTSGGFPFNMGWWGFIFPIGVFTLLTITIGEELESRFFKVLSCVSLAQNLHRFLKHSEVRADDRTNLFSWI